MSKHLLSYVGCIDCCGMIQAKDPKEKLYVERKCEEDKLLKGAVCARLCASTFVQTLERWSAPPRLCSLSYSRE